MNNFVHYLIRDVRGTQGLVCPDEVEATNYYTVGAFYLMGSTSMTPLLKYSFYAVLGERIMVVPLVSERQQQHYFAHVKEVGTFVFIAESFPEPWKYTGQQRHLEGCHVVRRLRALRVGDLEQACIRKNFYFIGYSNRIQAQFDEVRNTQPYPPTDPSFNQRLVDRIKVIRNK